MLNSADTRMEPRGMPCSVIRVSGSRDHRMRTGWPRSDR